MYRAQDVEAREMRPMLSKLINEGLGLWIMERRSTIAAALRAHAEHAMGIDVLARIPVKSRIQFILFN